MIIVFAILLILIIDYAVYCSKKSRRLGSGNGVMNSADLIAAIKYSEERRRYY